MVSGQDLALGWSYVRNGAAGSGAIDRIQDVAVDPGRATILCGIRGSSGLVVSLDPLSGDVLWTTHLSSTLVDSCVALVVDEQGSIYVTGNTTPNPPFPDVLVAKLDSSGNVAWIRSFNEPTYNNNDEGLDVALGPDDSVVVTGHMNGVQGGNFFTAKLTRSGDVLWTRQIDGGAGSQIDSADAVAVDSEGGVLVTGTSAGPATGYADDVLTAKYSATGQLLWTRRFDGADQAWDFPYDLAATSDGGAVVAGHTEGPNSGADPLLLRYGPDGSLLWQNTKGTNGGDSARGVVLDSAGNVYVAGSTWSNKTGFDVLVMKFRPNGVRDWQLGWDGGEGRGDAGQAIALDAQGRVLVGATSYLWLTQTDLTTLVVDPLSGKPLASAAYDGGIFATDAPLAIAGGADGGIFVGGFTNWPNEDRLALRYDLWSAPREFYCTAGTSAGGCKALLGTVGVPSATAGSGFLLRAAGVEGAKDGIFFFGNSGRQAKPWGSGTSYQCVVPPVSRGGLLSGTGTAGQCDGSLSQDLNALWCSSCPRPNHNPGAGATVQAQLWYRDPDNTSNQTTSLSDAIEFQIDP
jgi:uncharacterized delta-60 repeat protein